MGKGIDMARADAPEHAQVMDDFKDQLLIALIKRLAVPNGDGAGVVTVPVAEVDETGRYLLAMAIRDRVFHFELRKKS